MNENEANEVGHTTSYTVTSEGVPEMEAKPKPKTKRSAPSLKSEDVANTIRAIGKASLTEIVEGLYGPDSADKRTKGRVRHHIIKLQEQGVVKGTGHTSGRRYHIVESKVTPTPTADPGVGDLFEVVGLVGDTKLVRSLDSHQVYKLEAL